MIQANELNWGLKTCFFFAGLSFFFVVATWFVMPETSGRSAAELDELFGKKVKPWRFHKHVTEAQLARQQLVEGQGGL
jgi:SP family general alpha glucoside:H+ symporter-like MFS transporter